MSINYTTDISSETSSINSIIKYEAGLDPVVSYLKPNSFRFQIMRAPNITYTCQSANLPSMQIGAAMQPTPFVDIPHPGDKVQFGDFNIRFLINEDMSNYLEIYNWIKEIGVPEGGADWDRALTNRVSAFRDGNYNKAFSDGNLIIIDSNNRPIVKMSFHDMFPVNIEALDFDITTAGMEYFVGIATFRYKLFTVDTM
jgi:hypothetical protein